MTKQEYLSQVYYLEKKIEKMEERIKEYQRKADSPSSPCYDKVIVDETRNLDAPFTKWIYKIIELEKEIDNMKMKTEELKSEIINVIEELDNEDFKNLLVLRYINGATWKDISERLYITQRTVYRWHKDAIVRIKAPI